MAPLGELQELTAVMVPDRFMFELTDATVTLPVAVQPPDALTVTV